MWRLDAVDGRALDVEQYLTCIGYAGSRDPTPATFHALHRQHILTVPFEKLDIPLERPITLELEALFEKIVVHRRGGFCYELNTLFGRLVQRRSATVRITCARACGAARAGARTRTTWRWALKPAADDERHEVALVDAAAFGRALVEHQGLHLAHGEAETIVRRFAPH